MHKADRLNKILNVIAAKPIARQDELGRLLRKNGFSVTQASISRDLDELGVIKVNGVYSLPHATVARDTFGLSGLSPAGDNLIVAKCAPGLASAAAVRIDAARLNEIVGTIAGDDTIFIAVSSVKEQKIVIKKLWELFEA